MKEKFLKIWKEVLLLGIILLLITVVVRLCVYKIILTKNYEEYPDSYSYSYLQGYHLKEWNEFRTPVYPVFIRLIGLFGDTSTEQLFTNVAIGQELISLASVFIFYLTMRRITKNKWIQTIGTLWYGCMPSIFSYNLCILTESLSTSLLIGFFYTVVCYLQEKKLRSQIALAVQTMILTLLRPSFIYLFIFFGILWGLSFLREKENRKKVGIGILTTIVAGIGILGYCIGNQVKNGVMGLSSVSIINQTDLMIGMKIYGNYENRAMDEEITKTIEENIQGEEGPFYTVKNILFEKYGYNEVNQYVKRCIKHNLRRYFISNVRKTLEVGQSSIHSIYANSPQRPEAKWHLLALAHGVLPITFSTCYFIIGLELLLFAWNWWKKRNWIGNDQIRFYAMILLAGMIGVTLLGAQSEYQRLITPIVSMVIVLCTCYLEKIGRKQEKEFVE